MVGLGFGRTVLVQGRERGGASTSCSMAMGEGLRSSGGAGYCYRWLGWVQCGGFGLVQGIEMHHLEHATGKGFGSPGNGSYGTLVPYVDYLWLGWGWVW